MYPRENDTRPDYTGGCLSRKVVERIARLRFHPKEANERYCLSIKNTSRRLEEHERNRRGTSRVY